jgi:prepilin-type N-terminal cleavage/methylation domain-containing protein/prepilin-type processing-associated H-X9-DG protein
MCASRPGATRPRRLAFTLVELLVVIGIIAILVGLLVPAVNSARESARRTKCTNQMYQLGNGAIQQANASGYLPGWRNAVQTTGGLQPYSWPVLILPFIEKNDVYTAVINGASTAPSIDMFVCPSAPLDAPPNTALTYSGNAGSASNLRRADGVMLDTAIPASGRLGLDDISNGDGTTTTLLLAEKSSRNANLAQWTVAVSTSGTFDYLVGSTPPPCFGIYGTPPTQIVNNPNAGAAPGALSQPSSQHPSGAVVVFCDGHTGILRETITADVYAQALSWNHVKASEMSKNDPTASPAGWGAANRFPLSDGDLQ